MKYTLQYRVDAADCWHTFTERGKVKYFPSFEMARDFALDSFDERLCYQFEPEPAGIC